MRSLITLLLFATLASATTITTLSFNETSLPGDGVLLNASNLNSSVFAGLGITLALQNVGPANSNSRVRILQSAMDPEDHYLAVNTLPNSGPPISLLISFINPGDDFSPRLISGDSVSLFIWDTEASVNAILRSHDNQILQQLPLTTQMTTFSFTGALANVGSLELIDVGSDGFIVDSITFQSVASVPEPTTLLLVGGALIALGARWRRK